MVYMPGHLYRVDRDGGEKSNLLRVIGGEDGVEAVKLVCYRCGEDSLAGVVVDWVREVGVLGGIFNVDVA
jgi:hypothetical protein